MWIACVRDGIQGVTLTCVDSHSSCFRERWKGPEHRGEGCDGQGEDRSREHSFQESHVRVYGKENGRFRSCQCL